MANRPGRTPSPGDPRMHGYQLEDPSPYGGQTASPGPGRHNLEIPMGPGRYGTPSDRLQAQPTVRQIVEGAIFRDDGH
jgi:chitin synthase